MAGLALVLFLVWVLLAGAGRVLLQRHRTGDTGIRFSTGRPGSAQWWINQITAAPGLIVGVGGPLADIAGINLLGALERSGLSYAGVALTAAGIIATCAAQLAMGASWRIGVHPTERTALVTTGPFAIVRNPIFTAASMTFIGLTLMVPNLVAVAGVVILVAGFELQVRIVEEPYLLGTHGTAYERYAARVGRFVPGVGRGKVTASR